MELKHLKGILISSITLRWKYVDIANIIWCGCHEVMTL